MTAGRWRAVCYVALGLGALLFVPQVFAGAAAFFEGALVARLVTTTAALLKVLFLALGAFYAGRALAFFEPGNSARPAWRLLAVGLWLYLAAQSILGFYQVVLYVPTPFPSLADPIFITSMVLLIAALFIFVAAYRAEGYFGESREALLVALAAMLIGARILYALLGPVLAEPAPLVEQLLNVAYPVLDCALLVPALALAWFTLKLRGGSLRRVWLLLVVGFGCLLTGDVLFAYFSLLDLSQLEPVLDLTYVYAYVFIAWGAFEQVELLRS